MHKLHCWICKVPPFVDTARLLPSYIHAHSCVEALAPTFTTSQYRTTVTRGPAHGAENCNQRSCKGHWWQPTAPACWTAVHYTGQILCQCSRELSQSITSSAEHGMNQTVQMDRLGEPQNRRPAEQHPLPLQIRRTANNSKPTRRNRSAALSVSQQSMHRYLPNQLSPAYICYMKTSKDFESLQFLGKCTAGGGYAASEARPSNPANRLQHQTTWAPEVNQQLHLQLRRVQIKQRSRALSTYVSTLSLLSVAQTTVH